MSTPKEYKRTAYGYSNHTSTDEEAGLGDHATIDQFLKKCQTNESQFDSLVTKTMETPT